MKYNLSQIIKASALVAFSPIIAYTAYKLILELWCWLYGILM